MFVAPDPDTIVLTPGHAALTLQNSTGANTNLVFQGYGAALDSLGQLEADTSSAGDGSVTIDVAGDGAVVLASSTWAPTSADAAFTVACFTAGTRIATPGGDRPVEALREGDHVASAFGGSAPVIWIGMRHLECSAHPRPEAVWPVRIAAHAFGPGRPDHDLRLSPDHAIHVDGVLIPARALLNGSRIVQQPTRAVTYYHLELPRHGVVLAHGLPAESYLDTGNRVSFANLAPALQAREISRERARR